MPASRAAMEAGLEDQEARLAPQIQVADRVDGVLVLVVGRFFRAALLAAAVQGEGKFHLEAVPVTATLVAQQFHAHRQIQFHLDLDLSHPWPPWALSPLECSDLASSFASSHADKITAEATPNQGQRLDSPIAVPNASDRRKSLMTQ